MSIGTVFLGKWSLNQAFLVQEAFEQCSEAHSVIIGASFTGPGVGLLCVSSPVEDIL